MRGVDHPLDWRAYSSCAEIDPELWFPQATLSTGRDLARQVCEACPVRVECLAFAFESDSREGIWGGIPEGQRRRMHVRYALGGISALDLALEVLAVKGDEATEAAEARRAHQREYRDRKNAQNRARREEKLSCVA